MRVLLPTEMKRLKQLEDGHYRLFVLLNALCRDVHPKGGSVYIA